MNIKEKVKAVQMAIKEQTERCSGRQVRLVAVSKTKPVQDILEAYECGVRHFGENYIQQLEEKHDKLPKDIQWHFIGHLQSNKIKKLLEIQNLYMVETIDRQSLAEKLNSQLQQTNRQLNIMVQVKTSEEESKSGVDPKQLVELVGYIIKNCQNLKFCGLMTVGKQGDIGVFSQMKSLREKLCHQIGLKQEQVELSMGMSSDFLMAIAQGSTNVRVGSMIFGPRFYPAKS